MAERRGFVCLNVGAWPVPGFLDQSASSSRASIGAPVPSSTYYETEKKRPRLPTQVAEAALPHLLSGMRGL
jgi:hypothetical protein